MIAWGTRRLGGHLPQQQQANLKAAGELVLARRKRSLVGLAVFAISPLPSAQLFEAAGLLNVALVPLTVAYFAGRVVSYSLYLGGAKAFNHTNAGQFLLSSLTSPWGALFEVAMLAGLVALARVDWASRIHHGETKGGGGAGRAGAA